MYTSVYTNTTVLLNTQTDVYYLQRFQHFTKNFNLSGQSTAVMSTSAFA